MAMMWLNWRVITINATLQFLDIYIYIYSLLKVPQKKAKRETK